MKRIDTIDLEIIPKNKMKRAEGYPPQSEGCAFVINGKRFLDLINEKCSTSTYTYMPARYLYYEMTAPWCYEEDAKEMAYYPIVCCVCGETGCASIGVRIKRNDDVVEWYDISHISASMEDDGTKIDDLTFRFKVHEYDFVMEKLRKLAKG